METKQILHNLVVTRDGSLDAEWMANLEAEQRREALQELGSRVLTVATQPIRNFSLNMLDLLRDRNLSSSR